MCGIAGFAGFDDPGLIGRMCQSIAHRGPDDESAWQRPGGGFTLGMRRLAVRDPEHGRQPMVSPDGRVHLVFNGEIYNDDSLRRELEILGARFRTRCDTEIVLAAYLAWGQEAWPRLSGMFAVAVTDDRGPHPVLTLARDRYGIKPLYYHAASGRLLFASEMKALLEWSGLPRAIDLAAVRDYLALRYVPGPGCLFSAIRKLPPGSRLIFASGEATVSQWRPDHRALFAAPRITDYAEAVSGLGEALRGSVRRHLVADRPVGCFLSAGIDSMAIAALMAEAGPISTFSMGFEGYDRRELDGAAACARALGADHHELVLGIDSMATLPDVIATLDEPIGDPIVIAMSELARHARRDVVVTLSGDGADETLLGYLFQRTARKLNRWSRHLPNFAWPLAARLMTITPTPLLERAFDYPDHLGRCGRAKLARLLAAVPGASIEVLAQRLRTLLDPSELQQLGANDALTIACGGETVEGLAPEDVLVLDVLGHWLGDDILMKLDKTTMMHGLESRVPFLDPEVVSLAARLSPEVKCRPGGTKQVLRDAVRAQGGVPAHLINAPKVPFYIPLRAYLEAPAMRDILRRTMDPARLRRRGLVDPDRTRVLFGAPGKEGFLPLKQAFSLVTLELWFERFCPDASWG